MWFDPYNVILSLCQKSLVIDYLNNSLGIGKLSYQNLYFIDDQANLGKIFTLFMYFMNAWLQ